MAENTDASLLARLEEIQARVEKATKGPWRVTTDYFNGSPDGVAASITEAENDWHVAQTWGDFEHEDGDGPDEGAPLGTGLANADFIAHAREDIPYLLDALRRSGEALRRLQEEVDQLKDKTRPNGAE